LLRCDYCNFRTKWLNGLNQHVVKVHTKPVQVQFTQLTEEEKEKINLVIILDSTGAMTESFRCKNCEFQCTNKEDVLAHLETNQCSGDGKSHKCKKCPYKGTKNQLRGHVNFQHGGTEGYA